MKLYTLENIQEDLEKHFLPFGYQAKINEILGGFMIEPNTNIVGDNRKDFFDGLAIIINQKEKVIEVLENRAGENEDELWIYHKTRKLSTALTQLRKGNKREPIEIWD